MNTQAKEMSVSFKDLVNRDNELNKLGGDAYYTKQAQLISQMRVFLRTDFSGLSGKQMLYLCDLVQRHRPVALHSFLIACGLLIKK